MNFINKKSLNIKTTKPHIKTLLGYVCYKCDLIEKKFFFALDQNDNLWVLLYKHVKRGQKRLKKWTLPKQKLKYINSKTFYQKSTGLRFLPVWYNLKKKKAILILAKNDRFWVLLRKKIKFRPFFDSKRV